jgi:radical SAM superfamily enzyme YgiQ (UPF0313 family)
MSAIMKVAFLSANREKMPDAVIPIGLLYVMAACPEKHEKVFWDLCFDKDPHGTVARNLREFQPDLIAIGLRNIQNMDYTDITVNVNFYRDLMKTVRANSTAPVVLGGGGFSVMPQSLMEDFGADYGIAGEGERAFPSLLEELEKPEPDLEMVEYLHYRVDGKLRFNGQTGDFLVMDDLAKPDRSVLDNRYYSDYGTESLQTKRGCPLRCDYCTYPIIEGRKGRVRDPGKVADEFMDICSRDGVNHLFIVDSVFNLPIRHAKEVCRQLEARGNKTPWTSYINPTAFDDEMAELLARAGSSGMEVGSDSGCDEILDKLHKGFHTDKVTKLSKLSKKHGLKDCHSFILGTTGETLDHVERTLDYVEDLDAFCAIMLVWVEDMEVLDRKAALSRRKFRDEIYDRIRQRAEHLPRWIVPTLGIQFNEKQFKWLRKIGLHGPLGQYLDMVPTA